MNGDLGAVVDVEAAREDRRVGGILGTDGDAVPVLADHDGGGVRARVDLQKVEPGCESRDNLSFRSL